VQKFCTVRSSLVTDERTLRTYRHITASNIIKMLHNLQRPLPDRESFVLPRRRRTCRAFSRAVDDVSSRCSVCWCRTTARCAAWNRDLWWQLFTTATLQRPSFHYLLLRSYLYHCVWSVTTAHNLTPEKRDNNYLPNL